MNCDFCESTEIKEEVFEQIWKGDSKKQGGFLKTVCGFCKAEYISPKQFEHNFKLHKVGQ